jgi:hypothetical protein
MKAQLTRKLHKKYRGLFAGPNSMIYPECGDGWYWLLDQVCLMITQYSRDNRNVGPVLFSQIKEKWGGLRIYYSGGDSAIADIIWFAAQLSYSICENCGTTDKVSRNKKGWIQTLCKGCRNIKRWKKALPRDLIKREGGLNERLHVGCRNTWDNSRISGYSNRCCIF